MKNILVFIMIQISNARITWIKIRGLMEGIKIVKTLRHLPIYFFSNNRTLPTTEGKGLKEEGEEIENLLLCRTIDSLGWQTENRSNRKLPPRLHCLRSLSRARALQSCEKLHCLSCTVHHRAAHVCEFLGVGVDRDRERGNNKRRKMSESVGAQKSTRKSAITSSAKKRSPSSLLSPSH